VKEAAGKLPADKPLPGVKHPVFLVPEDGEKTTGRYWSVPPVGQYGTSTNLKTDPSGTPGLRSLVAECYQHLRGLRAPAADPNLDLTAVQRIHISGHSGGGAPLIEAAGADLMLPEGSRMAEIWLFDCTYGYGTDNYLRFCIAWKDKLVAGGARFICVHRPADANGNTEAEANGLRASLTTAKIPWKGVEHTSSADMRDKVFIRTNVAHDHIPTQFIPILMRTSPA
jgi:hypothetical protein